jgi:XTP/dITP diphosphohydrolase
MSFIVASGNRGKIREFRELFDIDFIAYKDILGDIEIEESGKSFKENALIKAREVYKRVGEGAIVVSDDSGLSVPLLNGEPNIYSARYAGVGASDRENLEKLIGKLKERGVKRTKAYYTASIAIVGDLGEYTAHGWCFGDVIDTPKGENGFGYDPIFIPYGYSKTFGELDESIKKRVSHRSKALENIKPIIQMLTSNSLKS